MRTKILLSAGVLLALSSAPLALWGCRAAPPADLPTLAREAEAAGWRVVPSGNGPALGFYAVPPDDPRSDPEELVKLVPGRPGWGGVVRCAPPGEGDVPPCYRCDAFMLHGGPDACRAFADAVGID